MSLTSALRTASAALALNSAQSAIVARNISNAGNAGYSRKIADVITTSDGARLAGVTRSTDVALKTALIGATSSASASDALVNGLKRLQTTVGDPTNASSPAALIGKFGAALQTYASTPSDASAGRAAVAAARALTSGLNSAAATTQAVRTQADADMQASVARITALLSDFDRSNTAVIAGTRAGADITDALDTRDAQVKSLANEIGLTTVAGRDGGLSLYTDSGVTLYNGGPRAVTMRGAPLAAGTAGAAVSVDGVAVTGAGAPMPIRAGALAALATLRDAIAPRYQSQLDEIARGLIGAFAEADQSATPTLPDRPGLFTWTGAPGVPTGPVVGLAGMIAVAASVDPDSGGDVTRLRDGGISQPGAAAYTYNTGAGAGWSGRLQQLADALDQPRAFDPASGLQASASLSDWASGSVGWLEGQRQSATAASAAATALSMQATQALSNSTGVNIDDQMSQMLSLENSYQASAKLLTAANSMFASLFAAIG